MGNVWYSQPRILFFRVRDFENTWTEHPHSASHNELLYVLEGKFTLEYPDGSRFTYDYNSSGQLVCTTFPDASYQTFEYDDKGNMTSMRGRDGVMNWYVPDIPKVQRDSLGRVVEEVSQVNGGPRVVTYRRDDHGNWTRRSMTGLSTPTRIDNRTFKYFDE